MFIFHIQNGEKQDALLILLFISLEYAMSKIQDNKKGLEMNGTHQCLVHAKDIYLLGENINTINKNTEPLADASKEVDLEVNAEKTEYVFMFMSYYQTIEQLLYIKLKLFMGV
jgi:hypothetical protein